LRVGNWIEDMLRASDAQDRRASLIVELRREGGSELQSLFKLLLITNLVPAHQLLDPLLIDKIDPKAL